MPAAAAQRADIAAQRVVIDKRYEDREHECQQRFVVTSCLNDARLERRNALAPLRQEELRIGKIERSRKAADRLEEIESKQRGDAERGAGSGARAASAAAEASLQEAAPKPTPPRNAMGAPRSQRPSVDPAERQQREARSAARFEAQRTSAARHRAEVEARNAERAATGKVARPLPVPPGASGP